MERSTRSWFESQYQALRQSQPSTMSPTRNNLSQLMPARKSARKSLRQPLVPRWVSEMNTDLYRRDPDGRTAFIWTGDLAALLPASYDLCPTWHVNIR